MCCSKLTSPSKTIQCAPANMAAALSETTCCVHPHPAQTLARYLEQIISELNLKPVKF
jgi:hypothetical protein